MKSDTGNRVDIRPATAGVPGLPAESSTAIARSRLLPLRREIVLFVVLFLGSLLLGSVRAPEAQAEGQIFSANVVELKAPQDSLNIHLGPDEPPVDVKLSGWYGRDEPLDPKKRAEEVLKAAREREVDANPELLLKAQLYQYYLWNKDSVEGYVQGMIGEMRNSPVSKRLDAPPGSSKTYKEKYFYTKEDLKEFVKAVAYHLNKAYSKVYNELKKKPWEFSKTDFEYYKLKPPKPPGSKHKDLKPPKGREIVITVSRAKKKEEEGKGPVATPGGKAPEDIVPEGGLSLPAGRTITVSAGHKKEEKGKGPVGPPGGKAPEDIVPEGGLSLPAGRTITVSASHKKEEKGKGPVATPGGKPTEDIVPEGGLSLPAGRTITVSAGHKKEEKVPGKPKGAAIEDIIPGGEDALKDLPEGKELTIEVVKKEEDITSGGGVEGGAPEKPEEGPFVAPVGPGIQGPGQQGPGKGKGQGGTGKPKRLPEKKYITGDPCRFYGGPTGDTPCEKCVRKKMEAIYAQKCREDGRASKIRELTNQLNTKMAMEVNKIYDDYKAALRSLNRQQGDPAKSEAFKKIVNKWQKKKQEYDKKKREIEDLEKEWARRRKDIIQNAKKQAIKLCDDICRKSTETKESEAKTECKSLLGNYKLPPEYEKGDLKKWNELDREYVSSANQSEKFVEWKIQKALHPLNIMEFHGKELGERSVKLYDYSLPTKWKTATRKIDECNTYVYRTRTTRQYTAFLKLKKYRIDKKISFVNVETAIVSAADIGSMLATPWMQLVWTGMNATINAIDMDAIGTGAELADAAITIAGEVVLGKKGKAVKKAGINIVKKGGKPVGKQIGKKIAKDFAKEASKQGGKGIAAGLAGDDFNERVKGKLKEVIKKDAVNTINVEDKSAWYDSYLGQTYTRIKGEIEIPWEICVVPGDIIVETEGEIVDDCKEKVPGKPKGAAIEDIIPGGEDALKDLPEGKELTIEVVKKEEEEKGPKVPDEPKERAIIELIQVFPLDIPGQDNNPFDPRDPIAGGDTTGRGEGTATGGGGGTPPEVFINNGTYNGDNSCGLGSIDVISNSETEFVANIPGNGVVTFTGNGSACPTCDYTANGLTMFGVPGHTATVDLTPPSNFFFSATNPSGGSCGELFGP